jgi:hypothetical protein
VGTAGCFDKKRICDGSDGFTFTSIVGVSRNTSDPDTRGEILIRIIGSIEMTLFRDENDEMYS